MRVLCLTFGDATTASTFYRIHQYKAPLAQRGIDLEIVPTRQFDSWDSLSNYEAVLVQKSLPSLGKLRQLHPVEFRSHDGWLTVAYSLEPPTGVVASR